MYFANLIKFYQNVALFWAFEGSMIYDSRCDFKMYGRVTLCHIFDTKVSHITAFLTL